MKGGLPLAGWKGMDTARTRLWSKWLRERTQLSEPSVLCGEVSQILGMGGAGARIWLELRPGLRAASTEGPFPAIDASWDVMPWVPRRVQTPEGAVGWIPWRNASGTLGWIAARLDKNMGANKPGIHDEWELLPAALHLFHLSIEQEALDRLESRDRFLAIASHELKTPLTALYGLMQLQERMLRTKRLPVDPDELAREQERHLSFARTMLRQVEKLVELTDGLLDLSKIRAGRFGVEPIPLDAARAVRELHEGRLKILAEEAGVELRMELPERLATRLDPLRFDELITNLSMQAIRRSPEGGQVLLELVEEGKGLSLRVRDQGQRIAPEDAEKLFEPFEYSSAGGLGLGLYLSRQIARLQGGDVRFVEAGGGYGNTVEATFWKAG